MLGSLVLVGVAFWPHERTIQSERAIEGRLTGRLEYAPYRSGSHKHEVEAPTRSQHGSLRGTDEQIAEIGEIEGSAVSLGDLGVRQLLEGRVDLAVRKLEQAVRLNPDNPRLLSNLAAARLDRVRQKGNVYDLISALDAASQAVEMDPNLEEARFNLALTLERLFLQEPAQTAWEGYLQLDSTSGWAGEARAHHADLVSPPEQVHEWEKEREQLDKADQQTIEQIVARFPQEARQHVDESLLGSWADVLSKGQETEADRILEVARRIGQNLGKVKGDYLAADAVAAIISARDFSDRTAALMEGHHAYREARSLYAARKSSRTEFERARNFLLQGGSPVEALASLYLGVDLMQRNENRAALEILDRIIDEPRNQRYPGLLGRVYWTIGLVYLGQGDPAASLAAYREALSLAQKAGSDEDVAGVHAVLTELYQYLGQPQEAWRHIHQALVVVPRLTSPQRLDAILTEAADACMAAGQWQAERWFRDEAVRVAERAREPVALSHALLRRGEVLSRLGKSEQAAADLIEARTALNRIENEDLRRRNEADLLIAEVLAGPGQTNAVAALTKALDEYAHGDHFFLRRLYLARARAHLSTGEEKEAEADLRQGIEESEQQRGRLGEDDLRISFFERSGDLYYDLIRLLAKNPDRIEEAFEISERAHARALLDRLGPVPAETEELVLKGWVEPGTSEEIRAAMPEGVALVEYALLEDRLLAWVLYKERIEQVEIPVVAARLTKLVDDAKSNMTDEALSGLYDALVRFLLPKLNPGDRLVIVPDKKLHEVPFAALRDRATGRYLVQDRILSLAPSATFYVEALKRDRDLDSNRAPTALAVGNPHFDRRLLPELTSLEGAEEEARALIALLPGSEELIGGDATPEAFLDGVPRHEIVHFGGHAVLNGEFPLLSYLVMAPGKPSESGLLYMHELYTLRLRRPRLVVLAACSSAGGPVTGEGPVSLARAFLAAGVPAVLASLTEIDDATSSRLLHVFYQHLRLGNDVAAALRLAQIAVLETTPPSRRSASSWGAFEVLGAPALLGNNEEKKWPTISAF